MQIGDEVVINSRWSSLYGLRGKIVSKPCTDFEETHWLVLLVNGEKPMLFGEKELEFSR